MRYRSRHALAAHAAAAQCRRGATALRRVEQIKSRIRRSGPGVD